MGAIDFLDGRICSCFREIDMLRRGIMCPPRTLILYPTAICNHRCQGCDYATEHNGGMLKRDQLFNIIEQFHEIGAMGLEACGGGEPTLHPDLPEAIVRASGLGMKFGLLTNGTKLLDPALRSALIAHGSFCRISIETADRVEFNAYKRPMATACGFDAIIANIGGLIADRDAAGSRLLVSLKATIGRSNCGSILELFHLADQLKVDSLQLKALRNVSVEISEAEAEDLDEQIGVGISIYPDLTVTGGFKKKHPSGRCLWAPLAPTVDASGDLWACCYYRHRRDTHRIGNILETPLRELWGSPHHWRVIEGIDMRECGKYDCRFFGYQKQALGDMQLEFI